MSDDISIEVPSDSEWDAIYAAALAAFNEEADEEASRVERIPFEPERMLVARRDGAIVGTAGIYTRQLAVPGALIPAGHITFVSVAQTARRQGLLSQFLRRQFVDMAAAGENIAVLWASEGAIYQRFGYGLAARKLKISTESREIGFTSQPPSSGRLRDGSLAQLRESFAKIFDEVRAERPGWSERTEKHWDRRLCDPKAWRRGAGAMRAVVHEGDHGPDGYALWRATDDWTDSGPNGEVRVLELVAANPVAYTALWRFLLTMDLTRRLSYAFAAVDEPLQFQVSEMRRLNLRLSDSLWVRVIDVAGALAARRYAAPVDVVIDVQDDEIPSNTGRWRLTGSAESARCSATTDDCDLRCDVRALGAAYLGGTSLAALAATGLITEVRPGALATASAAFGWHRAPSSIEVF